MSAYIKKTKARNGNTVIQVVFKRGRQVTKMVHVGTARNQTQEAELRTLAQDIINEGQLKFDLRDDPASIDIVMEAAYSQTLWDALSYVYDSLGFDALDDEVFKQLVLARIIEPTSKLDTIRVLENLGLSAPSNTAIHNTLARVIAGDYRDASSRICMSNADADTLSLLLYDVTTLYFEIQKEDDYRIQGLSKERRLEPQITIGLLVGRDGFPLEIASFEGNRAEVKTLLEVLDAFRARHGLSNITVTADAAMLSAANVLAIKEEGCHFIIASRLSKTPYEVAEYLAEPGAELRDGQIFETTIDMNTGRGGRFKQRVIYQYRTKRARMDLLNIDKLLDKAKRMVAGDREFKRNRYLKVSSTKKEINYALVEENRRKAGIKGYVTDLEIGAQEVIDAYHQLFEVERSFRMTKSDLKARPVFHRTRDSIEAHLTIVFIALAISRVIQTRTGVTIRKFRHILEPVKTGRVRIAGKSHVVYPLVNEKAQLILDSIYR